MRNTVSFCTLVLFCLFAALPAANAKVRRAAPKKASSSVRNTSSSSKKKTTGKRRVQTARRAPRQSEPTPERYMEIQNALVEKGFHPGPASGQWGPEWVSALKQFQGAQNMKVDGKLGALSLIGLGLGPKREPIAHLAGKPESSQ